MVRIIKRKRFLNYLLGSKLAHLQYLLRLRQIKAFALIAENKQIDYHGQLDKIGIGGFVMRQGKTRLGGERYSYIPQDGFTIYLLHTSPLKESVEFVAYYLFRSRSGKETFVKTSLSKIEEISVVDLPVEIWLEFTQALEHAPLGFPAKVVEYETQ